MMILDSLLHIDYKILYDHKPGSVSFSDMKSFVISKIKGTNLLFRIPRRFAVQEVFSYSVI